jgi:hypothetical protein
MLHGEIIAVCSEIHTEHTNTLCGQNVEFLGALAKLQKATFSSVVSVCRPRGTTRLQLEVFSWNMIWFFFENLSRKA